ncbi:MAG: type VI secretion system membrane subunit TssM [Chitinivibrionales bacterium]|nr:type VI secretion system membrane subunit TssM [Chitinivibrionales bacterium]
MKKKTKQYLIYWIILFSIGATSAILSITLKFFLSVFVTVGILCIVAALIWIILYFYRDNQQNYLNDQQATDKIVFDRVSFEINDAINRYLHSVRRKGWLRASALYERPWFMVCGPTRSGKTTLLSGSGLSFPLRYPSENEQSSLSDASGICWNFGNDAVWVDVPGSMIDETESLQWRASVEAIQKIRSQRPIDGMVSVIDINRIIDSDPRSLKDLATVMRTRVDELIASWGIEFPVYLVISKMDSLVGFAELFRDPAGKWNEQVLGATLTTAQQRGYPRPAFVDEYELLCTSLRDLRLRMLAKEKVEQRRRAMCEFVINFEGLLLKLADFIAELFRPSSYEGKPVFSGFYFAACQNSQERKTIEYEQPMESSGNTVFDHPLNPHRIRMGDMPAGNYPSPASGRHSSSVRAFFTFPLFREIIPTGSRLVRKTQKSHRREFFRHYSLAATIFVAFIACGLYVFYAAQNIIRLQTDIYQNVSSLKKQIDIKEYERLDRIGSIVSRLKGYDEQGAPWRMGAWLYQGKRMYPILKQRYFAELQRTIVGPAQSYCEGVISEYCTSREELSGDQYNELYKTLKSYLSLSEAVSSNLDRIDTISLRQVIFEAVKNILITEQKQARLTQNIETYLHNNIGLYLFYLRNGKFPFYQGNQVLIAQARQRLLRIPNAAVLYQTVLTRCQPEARAITLQSLLGAEDAVLLTSPVSISSIYTQDGWSSIMADAVAQICKNPYKIDWVVGTTNENMPIDEFDPDKLFSEIVALYHADTRRQWLNFLASVSVASFGDLPRCGRMLQMISQPASEYIRFFQKTATSTSIKVVSLSEMIPDVIKSAAVTSALTKKSAKLKKIEKTIKSVDTLIEAIDDVDQDELARTFGVLKTFTSTKRGALTGLDGYRDKIVTLAEKLTTLKAVTGENIAATFNGRDDDPLFSAWNYIHKEITLMPEDLGKAIEPILMAPLIYTGNAISVILTNHFNTLWNSDVATYFNNRFAGRYPFSSKEDEAMYDDVANFFRPATGVFWGFYDRHLSPFISKDGEQWQANSIGTVSISFDPMLMEALSRAEKIREIFYQHDGTQRFFKLTLSSLRSNKNNALLIVGDNEYRLGAGSNTEKAINAEIQWPIESGSQQITLKIFANDDKTVAQEVPCNGKWAALRLFDRAKTHVLNQSDFHAKWQINVQTMYMIYFSCLVRVSGSDHPFAESPFQGFNCPTPIAYAVQQEVVKAEMEPPPTATEESPPQEQSDQ